MVEDYSQADIDRLAEEIREYSARLSTLFQIAYGFDDDPGNIAEYVESEVSYRDLLDDIDPLLEEAHEALNSVNPVVEENREEQLYRKQRQHGGTPRIPDTGHWRDFYSEQETIDNERGEEGLDYRSLLRAHNDAVLFLLNASRFDEELKELLPDIDGDDAEIINETLDTQEAEYEPALVSRYHADGLDLEDEEAERNTFSHLFVPKEWESEF
jgi:hypothetical protein